MQDGHIVVTLDFGGSGAKASGFDVVSWSRTVSVAKSYPVLPFSCDDGECDVEPWWRAPMRTLCTLVEVVARRSRHYLGVPVSALRIPVALANADREVMRSSFLNPGRKAGPQIDIGKTVGAAEFDQQAGHWAVPKFRPAKPLWVRRSDPESWRSVRPLLQLVLPVASHDIGGGALRIADVLGGSPR